MVFVLRRRRQGGCFPSISSKAMADNLTINNNNNNNLTTRRNGHYYYWFDSLFTRFLYCLPTIAVVRAFRTSYNTDIVSFPVLTTTMGFSKFFSQKALFKHWYDIDWRICAFTRFGIQFNFCSYIFTINTINTVFELPLKTVPMRKIAWEGIKRNIFFRVVFSFASYKHFRRNEL